MTRTSRSYKTEGVILKRINFGEADKILTIYSKHYGKIKALAKGVRKITSRKGGNVELFNQVIIFLARGRNLDILTEVQVLNSFKEWRKNLSKVGTAYYFCELVDKLTPEGQPNQAVFRLLKDSLNKIGQEKRLGLTRAFEEKLLEELGFGIPPGLRQTKGNLNAYIEEITERKINSKSGFSI
ncbi:MAG TPA: DNA repair protein RecO [Nevskiaceae bacterium]|nr:DNA repair protein RecO [Nevskiaceae bacterium]